ncbi:WD40 repeat domain-containing protein, partial [Lentzea sp. NPDC006480]|uniref:WD40 repeat domain-containing protein n=1 Tax=Lentzea sp. NPDC006480 TaxID=3157176 RepID=UPI0033AF2EF3
PQLKHRIAVDGMTLRRAAISPDGRTLVTTNNSNETLVWDLTGTTPQRVGPVLSGDLQPITDMAFTDDGSMLVTADRHDARLWNISEPARTHLLGWYLHYDGASEINAVAFSPGGELLASGEGLWDVTRPEGPRRAGRLPVGTAPLRDVAFSPVRGLAAVAGDDGVLLVDVSDPDRPRAVSARLAGSELTKSLDFSPDGRTLAITGGIGGTEMWDVSDPPAPRRVHGTPPAGTAGSVSFSPDGHSLAVENTLWDLTGKFRPAPIGRPFGGEVRSLAFSPDGRTLAIGGEDRVALWRPADPAAPIGEPLTGVSQREPTAVTFAPDGRTLAAGTTFQDVTDPGRPRKTHDLERSTVLTVFSPDGNYFVTTTSGETGSSPSLWPSHDPARRDRQLRGHEAKVVAAAIAPDSRLIAGVGSDGFVRVWDLLAPGSIPEPLIGTVPGATSVAFSSDNGVLLAGGSSGSALAWDTRSVSRVGQPMPGAAAQVAFAPRGRLLATGSPEGTIVLWDMTDPFTPRQLGPPLGFRARGPLAFSPDGTTLAAGDVADGVRLWDLKPLNSVQDKPFDLACEILGGGLSEQDWPRFVPGLPYLDTCS